MNEYRLTRLLRTLTSEIYLVWDGERRIGQVDVHYADDVIHATVLLEPDVKQEAETALIRRLDREVVSGHREDFEREDFLVTVYRGSETTSYSDAVSEDELDLPDISW